jgi:iron complex outermembrane receptor protein
LTEVDRSGNSLPYSPADRYTLFLRYKKENGFKFKLMTSSWGAYYIDSENTETYEGYDFLLNAMAGYTRKNLDITLNIDNLTDKRYAVEVSKSYGTKYYSPASPRTILLTARYKF